MDSLCVRNPEIEEVLNLETGQLLTAQAAIGTDYGVAEQFRMRLAEENATDSHQVICPICRVGVYLCVHKTTEFGKRFYFKHRIEDGNCPAITRGALSKDEITARKYNGVKESAAHFRMKEIIAESLAQDPRFSSSPIEIEQVCKSDGGAWRKPDVRAVLDGKIPVVFEIQLSTTFLHVIAERRLFYRQHGALLCWVFQSFDPTDARMTQDDIFYNNNRNLFLASEQTLALSRENQAFMLDCHWQEPRWTASGIEDVWNNAFVALPELHHDFDNYRVFHFDYDQSRVQQAQDGAKVDLKQRFIQWWSRENHDLESWRRFQSEFLQHGVLLPQWPDEALGLLSALFSVQAGKPVHWRHAKLISAAHTVVNAYPEVLQPFLAAIAVYGRRAQLKREDTHDAQGLKWERKEKECREAKIQGDVRFNRDRAKDPVIAFLFPEVWRKLQAWDVTASQASC